MEIWGKMNVYSQISIVGDYYFSCTNLTHPTNLCPKVYIYVPCHGWASKTWIWVNEVTHKRSHTVWVHLFEMSIKGKSIEIESRLSVARGWGWEEGVKANGQEQSRWGDGNVLKQIAGICAQLCTFVKSQWIVRFNWVNSVICNCQ